MEEKLKEVDETLEMLIDLAHSQMQSAKAKNYFSKDLAEAVGLVVSLAYGRLGKK